MRVLGLIPARGGSKGVPRKNVRLLNGKPLLAYTAESALRSKYLDKVVLSTEDVEIAEMGKELGVDVPFMRPADLALDTTPSLPVVRHALSSLEAAGETYDAVCLLQPTNPLRRTEDIDGCIELFINSNATCVISVLPVPHEFNPKWVFWEAENGALALSTGDDEPIARRQELPPAFYRDGSVYVSSRDVLLNENTLYGSRVLGYKIRPEYSANIDTEADWLSAEERISARSASI